MDGRKKTYPAICHYEELSHYSLSLQQERIFYLSQLYPENTYWKRFSAKRVKGEVTLIAVEQAARDLLLMHEILNARIEIVDGKLVQKFPKDDKDFSVQFSDVTEEEASQRECKAFEILYKECRTPMPVVNSKLGKLLVVKIDEKDYLLVFILHHIITDASSFHILWKDFKIRYNAALSNEDSISSSEITYVDYVLWQKELLKEENIREQELYWEQIFQGELPVLDIPSDFPVSRQPSSCGKIYRKIIPQHIVEKLNILSLKNRVILYSTFLTTYYLLLKRYTNQDDIIIGTVFSGRQYGNFVRNMVGFFINTVAMRLSFDPGRSFDTLVKEVHELVDKAFFNQDYPFERLIQKINPDRDSNQNPLYRTIFNMVNYYDERVSFNGVAEEEWVNPETYHVQTDILFEIHNFENQKFEIRIEYRSDLFKHETISGFVDHFNYLLESITINPSMDCNLLEMYNPLKQEAFLKEYNGTRESFPQGVMLHQLFEEMVKTRTDEIAVIADDNSITYRELNTRADRYALNLKNKGIRPEQLVGVLADRGVDLIAAILGIVKSGAAYLPIEPSYPRDRIRYILEKSKATIVFVQEKYVGLVGDDTMVLLLANDELESTLVNPCDTTVTSSNLAYTIYTSGSTGKPKGVMITHEAAVNSIFDINRRFEVCNSDRILGISSVSFDLSVYDIFGSLAAGASLVLIKDQRNVREILKALDTEKITVWNTVPAIMEMVVDNIKGQYRNTNLRLVLLSGDWIPLGLPAKITKVFPNARIISLGGATEASIWSIYYPVQAVKPEWRSIPYGWPLANQTFFVFDSAMNLCPPAVRGELYIGGKGIARGYLNDSEKTESSFIHHPRFGILYKTGDWGRFTYEGYIEFMGRKDTQVKIRGYRIELGEIDKTLLLQPGVREALSIVREDVPGSRMIVSYIVSDASKTIEIAQLHKDLQNWLPHYMIPANIVVLESLPLSANGKVDHKMLPAPEALTDKAKKTFVVPHTPVERKLVKIAEKILNVSPIGLTDNFFEIGGNSLLTIRFISDIEEAFGVQMVMLDFIDLPVMSEVAGKIEMSLSSKEMQSESSVETSFWCNQLRGIQSNLNLFPASTVGYHDIKRENKVLELDLELVQGIQMLCRKLYSSADMVILSAYAVLLWRNYRKDELLIGVYNQGGDQADKPLLNPLPIRIAQNGLSTFADLVRMVRELMLDAKSYQGISWDDLGKNLTMDSEVKDYFNQVFFVNQGSAELNDSFKNTSVFHLKKQPQLSLIISIKSQPFIMRLSYNPGLIECGTAENMLMELATLLKEMVDSPEINILEMTSSYQNA